MPHILNRATPYTKYGTTEILNYTDSVSSVRVVRSGSMLCQMADLPFLFKAPRANLHISVVSGSRCIMADGWQGLFYW